MIHLVLAVGLLLGALIARPAEAAWAFVGSATGTTSSTRTVTSGNLLVAVAGSGTFSDTFGISDTCTSSWTQLNTAGDSINGGRYTMWWAIAACSGSNTVTITGQTNFQTTSYAEYSGNHASPFDQQSDTADSNTSGSGTDGLTTPSVTTTVDGELIVGYGVDNITGATLTAGTDFTRRTTAANGLDIEDKVQTSAGSVAVTWTTGATNISLAGIATFKPAASAGGDGTGSADSGVGNLRLMGVGR